MGGAVLAFGWKPGHGECGIWGCVALASHGSWNNPTFAAFTPFQTPKIFIKAVAVCHAEQDNKYSMFSPCSQPISGSHLSTHFYLHLKTQIKTPMPVFNL